MIDIYRRSTLTKEDKEYCAKCIFHGCFSEEYLCNHILITGKTRGCKAGVGCVKRTLEAPVIDFNRLICERCGSVYVGTKRTKLCMACRKESMRQNIKKAREARIRGMR